MTRSTPQTSQRGFTLIELVSVIAILAVVALVVGVPAMAGLNELRGSAAAARLAMDVRYLQRTAMASGLKTWLVVEAANDRYRLFIEDRDNMGKAGRVPLPHPLDLSTAAVQFNVSPYHGVAITSVSFNSTSELEFDNFGAPHDAGGSALSSIGMIVLSNGLAVRVYPVGGHVEHRSWP